MLHLLLWCLWHDFCKSVFKIKLKLCTRIASEWNTPKRKILDARLVYIASYTTDVCQYFVFTFIIARRKRGRRRKLLFEHWETVSLLHYDCRPMWILRLIVGLYRRLLICSNLMTRCFNQSLNSLVCEA
jgi:hypothetical protein